MRGSKAIALVLCASVLVSVSGCMTGQERATEYRDRLSLGMTRADVVDELGSPDMRLSDEADPDAQAWIYHYSAGGVGLWIAVIVATVTVIGAFALGVIGAGKHYFKVEFDENDCVKTLGPVRPLVDR